MSDPRRPNLDLPLEPPELSGEPSPRPAAKAGTGGPRKAVGEALPLFPDQEPETEPRPRRESPGNRPSSRSSGHREARPSTPSGTPEEPREAPATEPRPAPLGARFQAGLLDLLVHLALGLAALAAGWMIGVPWRPRELWGLALFLLVFSFLYTVIPLAFWGRTPGMGRIGLVARSGEIGALTFGQTAQRWLGAVLTVLLVGLPALLALLGGRSLADRLSDSRLWLEPS